jgi:hypothetical protein
MDVKYYKNLCPQNTAGIQLFRCKLTAYLESLQNVSEGELPRSLVSKAELLLSDNLFKNAIISYAGSSLLTRVAELTNDKELLKCAATHLKPLIMWPQERWNPQNFMISAAKLDTNACRSSTLDINALKSSTLDINALKSSTLDITDSDQDSMLQDMAKLNDEETDWLHKNLLPHLHEKSTFKLNKPMVLHLSDEEKIQNSSGKQSRFVDPQQLMSLGYAKSMLEDVERVIVAVRDKISPSLIKQLVKSRMKVNTLVCLAMFVCELDTWSSHFCEWFCSKLQIPLLVYDFKRYSVQIDGASIMTSMNYEYPKIWEYNLTTDCSAGTVIYTKKVRVICENTEGNESSVPSKKTISFLNGRNIPF